MTIGDDCVVERIRIEREAARGDWPAILLDVCCMLACSLDWLCCQWHWFLQADAGSFVNMLHDCMTMLPL